MATGSLGRRRHRWWRSTVGLMLAVGLVAAACSNADDGDDDGGGSGTTVEETTTQQRLPDLDPDLVHRLTNPALADVDGVLALFNDILGETGSRGVRAVSRFLGRLQAVNDALRCSYGEDRLAIGLYTDEQHWYSLGLVIVTRGESIADLVEAGVEVGACWLICQLFGCEPEATAADASAVPGPRIQGCFETPTVERDGETYQLVIVGSTDWMCAELQGQDSPRDSLVEVVAPATFEDLERLWWARRREVVDTIVAGGYGVGSDRILRGPGSFEVDLASCPDDWSDTEGISSTIGIGHPSPQSGNLAAYGAISSGLGAYVDYVNETHGGIDGRPIELIVLDDGYVATRTIERVDELLTAYRPLAVTTIGTPNSLAVYDTLNDRCVPQPFVASTGSAFGDPDYHPFTTGLPLARSTEAALWGEWLAAGTLDRPARVGALVMDNDFGLDLLSAFERWADAHPGVVSELVAVRHDPAAPSVTADVAALAEADVDVLIAMTASSPCASAIVEFDRQGLADRAVGVASSACAATAPPSPALDGWYRVGTGQKSTTDPDLTGDPFVAFVRHQLAARGLDPDDDLTATGFGLYGWAHVEALRIAADLPGGLSRTNLVLALRALDLAHPYLHDGLSFAAEGALDGFYVEGAEILRFESGTGWVSDGPAIDLDGTTPTCSWTESGCG